MGKIYEAFRELPLMEIMSLNMHAMEVDIVDLYLREWESNLAKEYAEDERTPLETVTVVRAFSRGWVFSSYELLRTWMQMGQRILALNTLAARKRREGATESEIQELLNEFKYEGHPNTAGGLVGDPCWQALLETAVATDEIASKVRDAKAKVAPIFRPLESLRVKLAKHELYASKRAHVLDAGYVRIDRFTGSLGCLIDGADSTTEWIWRVEIANAMQSLAPRQPARSKMPRKPRPRRKGGA